MMIWRFPKMGVPPNGWFKEILGIPLFSETPIAYM